MNEKIRERSGWIARNLLPHEPAIRAWLKRNRVGDLDVDDVIQEMYAKIVSLESLDHVHHPKHYAFQVAKFIVIDHIRRARIVSIFSAGSVDELGLTAPEADPEEQATFKDEVREITRVIAAMPARTRDVLVLRRVAGLSQRETADRLAISEKTVEKHMARGVLMLMDQFGRGGKAVGRPSRTVGPARFVNASDGNDKSS